jgi:hypothetical protein
MANYRSTIKQHTRPNLIKEEQSFFSSSLSWMQSAAQSVMSKTGQDYSLVKEVDPEFQETKQYFHALNTHFENLHAKAADDVSKTKQLAESLSEFSHSAELMSTCEANQDPVLAGYWKKLSGILRSMSELQEVLAKNETLIFDNTLRDYVRITNAGTVCFLHEFSSLLSLITLIFSFFFSFFFPFFSSFNDLRLFSFLGCVSPYLISKATLNNRLDLLLKLQEHQKKNSSSVEALDKGTVLSFASFPFSFRRIQARFRSD